MEISDLEHVVYSSFWFNQSPTPPILLSKYQIIVDTISRSKNLDLSLGKVIMLNVQVFPSKGTPRTDLVKNYRYLSIGMRIREF